MAPLPNAALARRAQAAGTPGRASMGLEGIIYEAWAEGYQMGSLIILMMIVCCNLKRGILLHKLILIEQFMAIWVCWTIYQPDPRYGWWFAGAMLPLYISYFLHNFISWLKIRPFLSKKSSILFMASLIGVQPYWGYALYSVYVNWNGLPGNHYEIIRPWETAMREPWWVFTNIFLILVIKKVYQTSLRELFRISSRFAVLIFCMFLSLCLVGADLAVTAGNLLKQNGMNPFWHLALVFKCAADTIFLDDFKKVLNDLVDNSLSKARRTTSGTGSQNGTGRGVSRSRSGNALGSFDKSNTGSTQHEMMSPTTTSRGYSEKAGASVQAPSKAWPREFFSGRSPCNPANNINGGVRSAPGEGRKSPRPFGGGGGLSQEAGAGDGATRIQRQVSITVQSDPLDHASDSSQTELKQQAGDMDRIHITDHQATSRY